VDLLPFHLCPDLADDLVPGLAPPFPARRRSRRVNRLQDPLLREPLARSKDAFRKGSLIILLTDTDLGNLINSRIRDGLKGLDSALKQLLNKVVLS
jgi:hypothetical protein